VSLIRSPLVLAIAELLLLEVILTFKSTFRAAREEVVDDIRRRNGGGESTRNRRRQHFIRYR
jgi:hypothetical protein